MTSRTTPRSGAETAVAPRARLRIRNPWSVGEVLVGVLLIGVFLWSAWRIVSVTAPLGHDEAIYALAGRRLFGAPDATFAAHRAPLLPILSVPVQVLADSERALRLVVTAFGVLGLLAAWWLGRRLGGAAGLAALIGVTVMPPLLRGATFFLTDLPAAALVLLGCALLWHDLEERRRVGVFALLAAGALAGSFYLRYGSALPILFILVTAAAIWWRLLWRMRGRVALVLTVFLLLLVPHLVNATLEFGTPWGRVTHTAEALARYLDVQGRDRTPAAYWELYTQQGLGGPLAAGALVVGVAGVVLALLSRRVASVVGRLSLFLVLPASAHVLVVGWVTHGDPRFLYPATYLAVTAGGAVAGRAGARAAQALHARARAAGAVAALVLVGVGLGFVAVQGFRDEVAERERTGVLNTPVKTAALEVATMPLPERCVVFTSYAPQVAWYSGCRAWYLQRDPQRLQRLAEDAAPGGAVMILFDGGKHQPEGAELDAYLAISTGDPLRTISGRTASPLEPVEIYLIDTP